MGDASAGGSGCLGAPDSRRPERGVWLRPGRHRRRYLRAGLARGTDQRRHRPGGPLSDPGLSRPHGSARPPAASHRHRGGRRAGGRGGAGDGENARRAGGGGEGRGGNRPDRRRRIVAGAATAAGGGPVPMTGLPPPATGQRPLRTALVPLLTSRVMAILVTLAIFAVLLRRIRLERLMLALVQADYPRFLAVMIPNTVFYFCWDTLVLTVVIRWFHASVRYRDLLPIRASSYVVAFFNTNAGRGALAAYLSRRLGSPFLQLGSTVLFLVLTEYMHLVAWATVGILGIRAAVPRELLWVPPAIALVWLAVFAYTRAGRVDESAARSDEPRGPDRMVQRWLVAPREWALLRTFRLAPARRYFPVVLPRAPMFFVSLCLHY